MPRSRGFLTAVSVLAIVSAFFYYRQNYAGQIGGAMSVAKILWLDYAVLSWFILPAFLWRSPEIDPVFRRLLGFHLVNWCSRAVIELWLLYVTIGWSPVYGIIHDVFSIALITWLARGAIETPGGRHFTRTLRITMACEIVFAALFHQQTVGETAIYFASDDPRFRLINTLTWIVVCAAYTDFAALMARLRPVASLEAAPQS